MMQAII